MNDRPLRLCLLSFGYPPHDTHGVSRSTHTLARGLVELGHEVHVVTSGDRHRVVIEGGIHVHQVNGHAEDRYRSFAPSGYSNLSHWLNHSHAVFDRVRALKVDHEIQIVDSPLWNLDGLVTAVAGELPVVVRVVTAMKQIAAVHDSETSETGLLADLEHEFLALASAVISNSRGTVRSLRDVYQIDIDATPHYLVPYGIVPVADGEVPDVGTGGGGDVTVLFVGRLEGRKGILDLFEAIPRVLREAPKTRFQIAGADNSREDGFRAAKRMDYPSFFRKVHPTCTDRVQLLGFVGEERLQKLYRECDVFVAPSLYESFGLVFLEAMNYARPVIGCRAGGPEDIIVDGETGLLVSPQNPQALADALIRLVRSSEERAELGRAGRRRLLEHYSHTAMAEGFVDAYRSVLASGRKSSGYPSPESAGGECGGAE
jgi:glycosyltransferase involved in cell wall biosynthesis